MRIVDAGSSKVARVLFAAIELSVVVQIADQSEAKSVILPADSDAHIPRSIEREGIDIGRVHTFHNEVRCNEYLGQRAKARRGGKSIAGIRT